MNGSHRLLTQAIVLALIASLTTLGVTSAAHGAIIGTEHMIEAGERNARIERIDALLMQQQVRSQLERAGVDPALAAERVRSLTNEELATLDARLDELPHGGDVLALVGAVFVVLLILELVGVTNIFSKI